MTPRRKLVLAALAGVSALLLATLAVATNIATGLPLPSWEWLDNPAVVWSLVAVLTITVAAIAFVERRLADSDSKQQEARSPQTVIQKATGPVYTGPVIATTPAQERDEVRICNLPVRNPDFTGRESLLEELGQSLAVGPVAVVAVAGMGGIGKSSVALEYAHRGFEERKYAIAWWVRAESPLTLAEDMTWLAEELGAPVSANQAEKLSKVRRELIRRDDWLLVFDNVPDAEAIRDHLPPGRGHVIITSRDRRWSGVARPFDVAVFDRAESVAFLLKHSGRNDEAEAAAKLAEILGDLPLALAQAAAYLDNHGGLSIARFLELYGEREVEGRVLATKISGYPHTVATTWLIHFDELCEQPAALQLLQLCSHLDPDDINLELLLSRPDLLAGPLTGDLAAAVESAAAREEAIGAVARTGLITRIGGGNRVRLHRLVAQITRHSIDNPSVWTEHVNALLTGLFPDEPWEPNTWEVCADLVLHARAAVVAAGPVASAARLLRCLGLYIKGHGEFAEAKRYLEQAFEIMMAVCGSGHVEVARTLNDLGDVLRELGEFPAASERFERALGIMVAVYGPDHVEVARTLNELGDVLRELGELSKALKTLERALEIVTAVHGSDHVEVVRTLNNLGNVRVALGEFSEASEVFQRALNIALVVCGPDHVEVARTLNNFGSVLLELGDVYWARKSLERALGIIVAVYGSGHVEVARILNNLGNVLRESGDVFLALEILERALNIRLVVYGPHHVEVAATFSSLGRLQASANDFSGALRSFQIALRIKEVVYGSDHVEVARTLSDLGSAQTGLGDFSGALEAKRRALRIFENVLPEGHPHIEAVRGHLRKLEKVESSWLLRMLWKRMRVRRGGGGRI